MMNKKTRTLALSAILSAFAFISLFIASVWPAAQMSLAAFSSIFVAAAVIESSLSAGVYVFVCSSLLSIILLPDKTASLLFILFFGYYPVIKSLIERLGAIPLQWLLKLVVFNAALSVVYFFLKELIFDFGDDSPGLLIVYIAGSAIFALFDYGFTKAIRLYMYRVKRRR
ncbi:MAG: hypothetical protein LBH28_10605 [Oscillospiraceae bacterium]|nr:hypothetical protein [Oscillospiraceae bacterium]